MQTLQTCPVHLNQTNWTFSSCCDLFRGSTCTAGIGQFLHYADPPTQHLHCRPSVTFFVIDIKAGQCVCVNIWKLFIKFNSTFLIAVIFSTHLKTGNFCIIMHINLANQHLHCRPSRWLFCHWYKSWTVCVNILTTLLSL